MNNQQNLFTPEEKPIEWCNHGTVITTENTLTGTIYHKICLECQAETNAKAQKRLARDMAFWSY